MHQFTRRKRLALALLTATATGALMAGCTSSTPASGATVNVTSTDDACTLDVSSAPTGSIRFVVQNDGTQTTEVYFRSEDGSQIIGEVEDIGPGLSRDLIVEATAGTYQVNCKPGMTGDGIKAAFTVTG